MKKKHLKVINKVCKKSPVMYEEKDITISLPNPIAALHLSRFDIVPSHHPIIIRDTVDRYEAFKILKNEGIIKAV